MQINSVYVMWYLICIMALKKADSTKCPVLFISNFTAPLLA